MTSAAWTSDPHQAASLADDATRAVLLTQIEDEPAVVLNAPPGSGKTDLTERLAVQSLMGLGERVMIVTQTNSQAFDLVRRFAAEWQRVPVNLFVTEKLLVPDDVDALSGVTIINRARALPPGPCIVVANAALWSHHTSTIPPFDLQVIDEAYQLLDARWYQISGLTRRCVLVGDPGQIAPVVTVEIERWVGDPAGPHVACPRAFLARRPHVRQIALPVTRRLVPDTVAFVQPAFYPDLPFTALARPGERRLATRVRGITSLDRVLDRLVQGASLVQVELPPHAAADPDPELAGTIVELIASLVRRGASVRDGDTTRTLTPEMIGVVCAQVDQVHEVQRQLPDALTAVLVETADRFQGLQREVMLVYHPLSGRAATTEFHLNAGRLCVMLSRHRVACVIVTRGGIADLLDGEPFTSDRVLGSDHDPEFDGRRAHRTVAHALARAGRVFTLN